MKYDGKRISLFLLMLFAKMGQQIWINFVGGGWGSEKVYSAVKRYCTVMLRAYLPEECRMIFFFDDFVR